MTEAATKRTRYDVARERRVAVLAMTKAGLSVLQIARALEIAPQSVYLHLNHLRQSGLLPSREGAA